MGKKIIRYDVALKSTKPMWQTSVPKVYTNDLNSVVFQFVISDLTTEEQEVATAVTMLYMRDGSFFQNPSEDVDKVGNVFSYTLKENEGNHAGIAKIQLVVTIPETDPVVYATQMYEFEVVNGLETKVAQEVMIYDWTTLTRDARAYIDQFVADELLRDAEFDNAQFDRNASFGAEQTSRTETFNASEQSRTDSFGLAESARAEGYTADHGRADTDHTRAENDSILAGTDHTRADSDSSRAGTDHTRAESDHTRADADSATVAGYNGRLAAEETATANNKISAVKGKTFADVDARLEDVEFDTAMMGTNLVTNGDLSGGTTGLSANSGTIRVENGQLIYNEGTAESEHFAQSSLPAPVANNIYYFAGYSTNGKSIVLYNRKTDGAYETRTVEFVGGRVSGTLATTSLHATPQMFLRLYGKPNVYIGTSQEYSFDNIFAINLTAAFGKGNEPTAEQMDGILAKFTNSWFDGTKNLFRANATLNKLMAVDARTEFDAKNMISNGNISNGVTGWTPTAATLSAVNNTLSVVGDGTSLEPWAKQTLSTSGQSATDKQYIRARIRTMATDAAYIRLYTNIALKDVLTPVQNQWYDVSLMITGLLSQVVLTQKYVDAAAAVGKQLDIQYVAAINLTATFGAGKEPTLAEMDRLMARFPNSWFDGVKPIQTIETLYQEKANKAQEAWITPTLTNGWTAPNILLGYRKTDTGKVEMRGTISGGLENTIAFTLPEGYRPTVSDRFFVCENNLGVAIVYVQVGGTVLIRTRPMSGRVSLEQISFYI